MNLSHEETSQFFKLMWALQFYVNRQLKIVPGVESAKQYAQVDSEEKLKARDALWAHPELLEAFVAENPASLSPEEIQIVVGWKRRIAGKFYILRFLKRYAIFLSAEKDERVYGVVGLYDSLEDVMGGWPLPIMVEAVLLPFQGRIIYDGLLIPYSISFGPGIRGDLNEIYQRAKQAGKIVESLEPGAPTRPSPKAKKPKRDWGLVLDSLVETTEQLRQADTMVQTRAFGMLKASARLAQVAAREPENLDELFRLARSAQTALRQLETALNRAEYS
jgi:hypothetical protein